jgi:hypothetical protein
VHPVQICLEDDNCNVLQKAGKLSTFDVADPQKYIV